MEQSDGYKLIRNIGGGIAGPLWSAEGPAGRAAMRRFSSSAPQGGEEWIADRTHFIQAGKQAIKFKHPRVLEVLEVIDDESDAWIASEFTELETLDGALKRGRLPADRVTAMVRILAMTLDQAHRSNLVHGDLKPSCIFVDAAGQVRIADFAISPRARRGARGEMDPAWIHPYLTPEHLISPGAISQRTDVYALAGIAWQLYTGRPPFSATDTKGAILRGQLDIASVVNRALLKGFEDPLRKAMSRDPNQRFGSCAELASALESAGATAEPLVDQTKSKKLIYAGLGSLALALIVVAFLLTHHPAASAGKVQPPVAVAASGIVTAQALPVAPTGGKSAKGSPFKATTARRGPIVDGPGPFAGGPTPGGPTPGRPTNGGLTNGGLTTSGSSTNGLTPGGPPPPYNPPPKPPPPGSSSTTYVDPSLASAVGVLSAGARPGYSIQLYSRDIKRENQINDGMSFGFNNAKLGELAVEDLKAVILLNGQPAKGILTVQWLMDGTTIRARQVKPNSVDALDYEPQVGHYQIILRQGTSTVAQHSFSISPGK
jgi:serine/threonine protein kinase